MAARSRFLLSPIAKLMLGLIWGLSVSLQVNAWQTKTESDHTTSSEVVAFERNSRGDMSEVYRRDSEVFLTVTLAPGFIKFSPSNCPTLQIDQRVPVHHYETGPACLLSADSVSVLIATINNNLATSLPLHRLMNGSQLAVRFVTASGEYRESLFSLRNSKQALQSALGDNVEVEPNASPTVVEADGSTTLSESVVR